MPPPTPHCVGWDQSSSFQGTFRQLLLLSGDSQAHLQSGIWWIRHRYTCPGTPFPVEEGTSCWDRDTGKCKRLKLVQSTSPDTRSVFICHLLYKSNFFFLHKSYFKNKVYPKLLNLSRGIYHQMVDLHGKPEAPSIQCTTESYIFQ